jgi:hypothetical protein
MAEDRDVSASLQAELAQALWHIETSVGKKFGRRIDSYVKAELAVAKRAEASGHPSWAFHHVERSCLGSPEMSKRRNGT